MSDGSQPEYFEITVRCECGSSFQTRSTVCSDFRVEICSACHPCGQALGSAQAFAREVALVETVPMNAQR